MQARRLLIVGAGGGFSALAVTGLVTTKFAGNPVIEIANNPNEHDEEYVPAPIKIGSDVWVFVKGDFTEYAWKSTDGGETFALQNSNNPVIVTGGTGTWDDFYALEAAVTYDPDEATVRFWYKGEDTGIAGAQFDIGYATAPSSDPTDVTKDPANPILTGAAVATAIGGTVTDISVSNVVKAGGLVHFFGYLRNSGRYKLWHAEGTDWTDLHAEAIEIIATAAADTDVIQNPSVFKFPGPGVPLYGMFYSDGLIASTPIPSRAVRIAHARSLSGPWTFPGTAVVEVGTGWEEQRVYAAQILTQGYGLDPVEDGSGRWLLYYSGSAVNDDAESGLAYVEAE